MNQNENKNENEIPTSSAGIYAAAQKPAKKPITVSLPMTIVLILLSILITFQTTFVVLSIKHTFELVKTKAAIGEFDILLETLELYEENHLYDIDRDELIDYMLDAFGGVDRYASYYNPEEFSELIASMTGTAKGIGIYIRGGEASITVTHVMNGSPAQTAGILAGDVIVAIDGTYISEIGYAAAVDRVAGESGTQVVLSVSRNGAILNIPVTRGDYTTETVIYSALEESGEKIGYIHIVQFDKITVTQFKTAMEELSAAGCKKFVFDLRDNPGGDLDAIVDILDYLLPEGPIVHILDKDMNVTETFNSDASCVDAEMTVIVNGNTASAAELFTSALRDYEKAKIVGLNTYGKGCGQTAFRLSNGGCIYITAFFYNPPFGENYDGEGIAPNIEVALPWEYQNTSILLLPRESDTQLEAALAALTK